MAYSTYKSPASLRFSFLSILLFLSITRLYAFKSFAEGEVLTYKIYYHLGLVWVPAAQVTLSVVPNVDSKYVTFRAVGATYKRYDLFFKVRESFESTVLKTTLLPVVASRSAIEDSYKAEESYLFDQRAGTVDYKIIRNSGNNTFGSFSETQGYFDILSAAYYIRESDYSKLHINDLISISIIMDGEKYNMAIRFLGYETCKDHNKKPINCAKFSVNTIKGTVFNGDEHIFIWMSLDEAKLPIKVVSKIRVGEINGQLIKTQGTK
jgi:hypothetical protein